MNGPKTSSALSPFNSQLRTLIGAARRPHSCQLQSSCSATKHRYSIASSAVCRNGSGMVSPSAFAVLRPHPLSYELPGRARPVAVAARGIARIAARAISVPVAGMSNIAAAVSHLALGKKVLHVGQRRCRHSHAAAQRSDDTDRESFHETGRVSSDAHGSLLETGPLLRISRLD
jgi:hypothetical protein